MKKILVILPRVPYPLNSGGNIGTFNMLKAIESSFEVHIWFMIREGKKFIREVEAFRNALGGAFNIHYTIKKKGFNKATSYTVHEKIDKFMLRNDLQEQHNRKIWGRDVNTLYTLENFQAINEIIIAEGIGVVQIEYNAAINFVYALPKHVKKVFIHHELLFMRYERQITELSDKSSYDDYQFYKQKSEEINVLNQYDCVITLSDTDRKILLENGVVARIESSPLFIPTEKETYPDFIPVKDRSLIYLASGTHKPNSEGLLWFINNVHPILIQSVPDYKLIVVGSNWESFASSVNIPLNISFLGFVEYLNDVVPGKIMIVPILSGSGMRMKILEAVNNSVPFVSTYVGAEGMGFVDEENCFIKNEPNEFADSIYRLMEDCDLQKQFVEKARIHFDNHFSPSALGKRRVNILKSV